mmetsp:Transcript_8322/g.25018  ORF Transcript_8322/g.25018 Transcript_8322/m.25018 type:complete len:324 (-) Transcript_8322:391-1362(-)|eukprot:CAMPEP_0198731102 /NCGR_PEP_ID=MMETSP1475-20131203/28113_1 /TAXON_ID= ORGANISM="Unidentified sp., Strain CCMP1999" /NCGR_SAMPLE_ID=MMETSP1475 /ASSEMBLY_ACC=CAM_ASM_001111 /LENGTH=323 /DNA_ID=CAMNT_0044494015 /DNA_START=399 /DNA_END=1370 /DNA_ORIENTATION=-
MPGQGQWHVVVGGRGEPGRAITQELLQRGLQVRTIGEGADRGEPSGAQHISASSTDEDELVRACQGARVIYHCIDLEPTLPVCLSALSRTVANCIIAGKCVKAVVVFVDSMWCYDPKQVESEEMISTQLAYTEADDGIPSRPKLHTELNRAVHNAHRNGVCRTAIVRVSDLFGPGITRGHLGQHVFRGLIKDNPKAHMYVNVDSKHSYTYIEDMARVVAMVGLRQDAWGKCWHVPCAEARTTREMVALAAGEAATLVVPPRLLVMLMAFASPHMTILDESRYRFKMNFTVVSDFETKFPEFGGPTALEEALQKTMEWYSCNKD